MADKNARRNVGVGIGVFVSSPEHPNCVIVGKRKGSSGSGQYGLPGGHLEFGGGFLVYIFNNGHPCYVQLTLLKTSEEWSECAIRETLEETGLKIKNVSFATIVNAVVPKEDYHYITVFMKGEIDVNHLREPENLEPDKCDGWDWYDWYDPEKFPTVLFEPLRIARIQGYQPFDSNAHGHSNSTLFSIYPN